MSYLYHTISVDVVTTTWDYAKDFLLILSGIGTVVVAYKGLQSRKDQKKREWELEVVRKLLHATYKLREAFLYVRNPFIPGGEFGIVPEWVTDSKEKHYYELSGAYQKRWDKVIEASVAIQESMLELEVIAASGIVSIVLIKKQYDKIYAKRGELLSHIQSYLNAIRNGRAPLADSDEFLYAKIGENEKDDAFYQEIVALISNIEKEFKPIFPKK